MKLLPRAARAVAAAEGGPPEDGGFEGWLMVRGGRHLRLVPASPRLHVGRWRIRRLTDAVPLATQGDSLGLRKMPTCGRVKLEGRCGQARGYGVVRSPTTWSCMYAAWIMEHGAWSNCRNESCAAIWSRGHSCVALPAEPQHVNACRPSSHDQPPSRTPRAVSTCTIQRHRGA